jgi:hypothetical protein
VRFAVFSTLGLLMLAAASRASTVVDCPFNGSGGDYPDRAFYVSPYPATSLGTVTLHFYGAGSTSATLEARLGAFNGTAVAPPSTRSFDLVPGGVDVTFDFGDAPVPASSTVAFFVTNFGSANGVDTGPCGGLQCATPCAGVIETDDHSPPLSTPRRVSMGVRIDDVPEPGATVASLAAITALALLAL